mgnify:CR=1 FL=1
MLSVTPITHSVAMANLIEGVAALLKMIQANAGNEEFEKNYHEFFEAIHKRLQKNEIALVDITKDIISEIGTLYAVSDDILTPKEFEIAFKFLQKMDEILSEKKSVLTEEEEDEEEDEGEDKNYEDNNEKLEQTAEEQFALVETLGNLVKHNLKLVREKFEKLVIAFYTSFLVNTDNLKKKTNYQIISFPVCDLFEFFTPDHPLVMKNLEMGFLPILEMGATHPELQCRQTASYAIGMFAKNSKSETFNKYQHKLLGLLKHLGKPSGVVKSKGQSVNLDYIDGAMESEEVKYMVDNIGGAYGKILKYHETTLNQSEIVNEWLRYLPLKADQPEMQIQHEFFADLILGPKFELLCGENQERKNLMAQKITEVRAMSEMIEDPMIKRKIENAYLKLTKTD